MKLYKFRYLIIFVVIMIANLYQAHCVVKSVSTINAQIEKEIDAFENSRVYKGNG